MSQESTQPLDQEYSQESMSEDYDHEVQYLLHTVELIKNDIDTLRKTVKAQEKIINAYKRKPLGQIFN